jgi:hypothetical protein
MDDKIFREQLSLIAEWYIPIVADGSNRDRVPMVKSKPNRSMYPVIKRLKPIERACVNCGMICSQRCSHTWTVNHYNRKLETPNWTHNCQTCKRPIDPITQKVIEKLKITEEEQE